MTDLRPGFESWAHWYDHSALQSLLFEPAHRTVLEQLRLHAPHASRMLDVGCGTGRLLAAAAFMYPMLVGVDSASSMLRVALARDLRSARFVCAGAELLPFASGSFPVVTSTLSLRHWRDPARGVGELARVLSRDGVAVVADADRDEDAHRRRRRWGGPSPRFTWLGGVLADGGLEVVEHRSAPVHGPMPHVYVVTARKVGDPP